MATSITNTLGIAYLVSYVAPSIEKWRAYLLEYFSFGGGGRCVSVYPEESWGKVMERLEALSVESSKGDDIQRRILANSFNLEIDTMGRVLIPEKIRTSVNIVQDVCINGKGKKLEIWDAGRWNIFVSESAVLEPEINTLIPGL